MADMSHDGSGQTDMQIQTAESGQRTGEPHGRLESASEGGIGAVMFSEPPCRT